MRIKKPSEPAHAPVDGGSGAKPSKPAAPMGRRHVLALTAGGALGGFAAGSLVAGKGYPVDTALDAYNCTGPYKCSGDDVLDLSAKAALARRLVKQGEAMTVGSDERALAGVTGISVLVGGTIWNTLAPPSRRRGFLGSLIGLAGGAGLMAGAGTPEQRAYEAEIATPIVKPALKALQQEDPGQTIRAADDLYFSSGFARGSNEGRALSRALKDIYEKLAVSMRLTDPDLASPIASLRATVAAARKSIER